MYNQGSVVSLTHLERVKTEKGKRISGEYEGDYLRWDKD
jgi:hypothetical protein